ncbi:MAG: fibronectin type III domain-containing protein [Bacteroidia bacterium]|nr:fibronectin type III domain-containing protein [Bacteroidia bacterium]
MRKIIFLGLLFIANSAISQSVYTRLHAGPKGVWVMLGKQIPKDFHYDIERKNSGDWEQIRSVYAPTSRDEIQARVFDIVRMDMGYETALTDDELDFLWKECKAGRSDSLFGYFSHYPVLYALGLAYYDGEVGRSTSCSYRIKTAGKRDENPPATTLGPVTVPGQKMPATFKVEGAKATGDGISIEYVITNKKDLHHVLVYRSYYLRSGYEIIHPKVIFYKDKELYFLNVLDQTAAENVPYAYVVVPADAAGNLGDSTAPFAMYNVPENSLPPSVERIKTTSIEKEKAIRVSWVLKNTKNIVSIDIFKSLMHDGRFFKIASAAPNDTAYMDYEVEPIKTYFYTIVLNGAFESSSNSPRISGMLKASNDNLLPINNLDITQEGDVVKLTWNRAERDTRAYQIYRANGVDGELLMRNKEIESDSNFIWAYDTLPQTEEDAVYAYSVRDMNTSYVIGPYSKRVLAYGIGTQSLPIPTNVSVQKRGENGAWIVWKQMEAQENSVLGYELVRREINIESGAETSEKWVRNLSIDFNQFYDSTLRSGYSYFYSVKSTGPNNKMSSPSLEQGITIYRDRVLPVSSIQISTADGKVELNWSNPNGIEIKNIRIERSTIGTDQYEVVETVQPSNTNLTDSKVTKGKEYFYRLVLVDANGNESEPQGPYGIRVR